MIEIMVTVALMSIIILGLLAMFDQTQRAFRTGMTQVDTLEAGRNTMEMLARELEQLAPANARLDPEALQTNYCNFLTETSPRFPTPLIQGLPGSDEVRSNLVQRFFFLSRQNQDWIGTGYEVIPDYPNAPVGTLFRYSVTNWSRRFPQPLSSNFVFTVRNGPFTNLVRIADGVVHLRVRPYAANGFPILSDGFHTNAVCRTNALTLGYGPVVNTVARYRSYWPEDADCYFVSNAVPTSVELEMGILEQEVLQRYRSIGSANAVVQRQYLSNHVAQVHIFRQRIPVRNVDLSVYP